VQARTAAARAYLVSLGVDPQKIRVVHAPRASVARNTSSDGGLVSVRSVSIELVNAKAMVLRPAGRVTLL
jgi:hypothetical protein